MELTESAQRAKGARIAVPEFLEKIREKDAEKLACSMEEMSQKLAEFLEVSVDCKLSFSNQGDIVDKVQYATTLPSGLFLCPLQELCPQ